VGGVRRVRRDASRASKFLLKAERIPAWFDHCVSNGCAEAVNALIQETEAAAFGYANVSNFMALCMLRYGDLPILFRLRARVAAHPVSRRGAAERGGGGEGRADRPAPHASLAFSAEAEASFSISKTFHSGVSGA
jgi:hypothetical protein